jgi:hypothetical protein
LFVYVNDQQPVFLRQSMMDLICFFNAILVSILKLNLNFFLTVGSISFWLSLPYKEPLGPSQYSSFGLL